MAKTKNLEKNYFHLSVLALSSLVLVAVILIANARQSQAGLENLDWKKEVSQSNCDTSGAPVINVTQKVVGSVDSGEAGNNWAFDNYNRKIQVWAQADNSYCALVDYEGKFDSQAGQTSPGNTGPLTGKEDGNFKGGYRSHIVGSLKNPADLATNGSIGTVDYQCNLAGTCPGAFNWLDKYFVTSAVGFSSNLEWWGWQYQYKNNRWINSSDGNSGDII